MTEKALAIETESFRIIDGLLRKKHPDEILPVLMRVIHATGDIEYEKLLRFHPLAIQSAKQALYKGKALLVDVKMVEAGINKKALERFGSKILCGINLKETQEYAGVHGLTRAEAAIELMAKKEPDIGIIVIGNAPTALLKTMQLVEKRLLKPDVVIGVPVGFVKAEESKEILSKKEYPFVTCIGTKGGSAVAVAIVNAIVQLALKEANNL